MTALAKWNPFRELDEMRRDLGTFFGRTQLRWPGEEAVAVKEWAPLVDVTEDEKEFLIKAELPEVPKEHVKVTVENRTLRITGERKMEKEEKGRKVHRIERAYGLFERAFTLPEGTQEEKVTAEYKDGLLMVHLPKDGATRPAAMEVKVT
jgi:HSP20 family protein